MFTQTNSAQVHSTSARFCYGNSLQSRQPKCLEVLNEELLTHSLQGTQKVRLDWARGTSLQAQLQKAEAERVLKPARTAQ